MGLGECRFPLDVTLSVQELIYELEAQFAKLIHSGKFDLLRAEEGGSKVLHPFEMSVGGYTCECIKVVVHSAKVYSRPLKQILGINCDIKIDTLDY